jgi:hypothetical protein
MPLPHTSAYKPFPRVHQVEVSALCSYSGYGYGFGLAAVAGFGALDENKDGVISRGSGQLQDTVELPSLDSTRTVMA